MRGGGDEEMGGVEYCGWFCFGDCWIWFVSDCFVVCFFGGDFFGFC